MGARRKPPEGPRHSLLLEPAPYTDPAPPPLRPSRWWRALDMLLAAEITVILAVLLGRALLRAG